MVKSSILLVVRFRRVGICRKMFSLLIKSFLLSNVVARFLRTCWSKGFICRIIINDFHHFVHCLHTF